MFLRSLCRKSPASSSLISGFTRLSKETISEIGASGSVWRHDGTGAMVMSLWAEADKNKTFSVTFRTPVEESCGVAHVLEHSVLCGSKKYPLKEPFVELLKSSHQTFLNAFTYPDRTCYPVSSCNEADFYNLVDVYCDAVFHPRAIGSDDSVLRQEGWRLHVDSPDAEVSIQGVVYNEMKGVYSSPDSRHYRGLMESIFPNSTYAKDSGGDPPQIPTLTLEKFRDFHAKHYAPSNAVFWFSGDGDEARRLQYLAGVLEGMDPGLRVEMPADQTYMKIKDVWVEVPFGYSETAPDFAAKSQVAVGYLLLERQPSTKDRILFSVLDMLLLGSPTAILQRRLLSSGLGSALSVGSGCSDELKQPVWTCGLKDVKREDRDKVVDLVHEVLLECADKGFSSEEVTAAVNTVEFKLRELDTQGHMPRGLDLYLAAMSDVLYVKPEEISFAALRYEAPLAELKAELLEPSSNVLQHTLKSLLLENPHKIKVETFPDPGLAAKEAEAEREAALRLAQGMDKKAIFEKCQRLQEMQQAHTDPALVEKCLPTLRLEDMPKVELTPNLQHQGTLTLHPDLKSTCNGIAYVDLVFDISSHVDSGLIALVPLVSRLLTEMPTAKFSRSELQTAIQTHTGGISVGDNIFVQKGPDLHEGFAVLRGKVLAPKIDMLGDLFSEILSRQSDWASPQNVSRIREIVAEMLAVAEARMVRSGHSFAGAAALRNHPLAGKGLLSSVKLSDQVSPPQGYRILCQVKDAMSGDEGGVRIARSLQNAARTLFCRNHMKTISVAGADSIHVSLPDLPAPSAQAGWVPKVPSLAHVSSQGLLLPGQCDVNYSGMVLTLKEPVGGSGFVVSKVLGMSYLWDKVRVVGGAYGAMSAFDPFSNSLRLQSYRDPEIAKTKAAFLACRDWLASCEEDVVRAVVGSVGDLDNWQSWQPDRQALRAVKLMLQGESAAERQKRRDEVLASTLADLRRFGQSLEGAEFSFAVLGGEAVKQADGIDEWKKI